LGRCLVNDCRRRGGRWGVNHHDVAVTVVTGVVFNIEAAATAAKSDGGADEGGKGKECAYGELGLHSRFL
jgi:hypothetical protein